ncbi:exonuclease SbcCD subunit D C-terminal domain-containing protein [Sulfurirhabdus autotrophica]|uniref:Nuclease SbcCD subunit D n=1 Tax=Sulfurirhabdus autotrophica TaxID=1706046 RepID=A0A4R3YHC9_9PROT|nr:exonuclease SbcCD subunit D C-terminal domain-containing protein [Sulfurirhabdus autotrophica]TCV90668.1 exodeoxyribonuclease I subunit D [Sulfurirhabdus autotrophica]
MLRIIHTADWHLGHTLHGMSREYEHKKFLDWLLDTLGEQVADALIIAGDVFDSANPPAKAQSMLYHFLAQVNRRYPALQVVLVGGNHDSAARLDAPQPLLKELNVHVVGGINRGQDNSLDCKQLLVPLADKQGNIVAWCVAVPFLRPGDLLPVDEGEDPLIQGVRDIYREALIEARTQALPGQALLATGHCYMVGAALSELSERKILGGNQHALPVDIFPTDIAYAALGHLHLAQSVGGRENVRYSGSPIPLSLSENVYPHQVVSVDIEAGACVKWLPIRVPRVVEILRLPPKEPLPLADILVLLEGLDLPESVPEQNWPYLEVSVLLDRPEPGLRRSIDEALAGKGVRLLKISTHYPGERASLSESMPEKNLQEITPDDVFSRRYQQLHDDLPPKALMDAFHEMLEQVQQGSGQ